MHKSSTQSQAMGSGGGGLFSSTSNGGSYQCSNHGSSSSASGSSTASCGRCDCIKCTYCQQFLGNISIKCGECVNFHLCLKVRGKLYWQIKSVNNHISFYFFTVFFHVSWNRWAQKRPQLFSQGISSLIWWDDLIKVLMFDFVLNNSRRQVSLFLTAKSCGLIRRSCIYCSLLNSMASITGKRSASIYQTEVLKSACNTIILIIFMEI
jgi:hypothetical protein